MNFSAGKNGETHIFVFPFHQEKERREETWSRAMWIFLLSLKKKKAFLAADRQGRHLVDRWQNYTRIRRRFFEQNIFLFFW